MCFTFSNERGCGGIGIRAALKKLWGFPCGFDSHHPHHPPPDAFDLETLAYVIGVAIGDGNLSNPNGRAVRLRITCDTRYPKLIEKIKISIQKLLPENKVSFVQKQARCIDISCYSNKWERWLGWKSKAGPKLAQGISIPSWIMGSRRWVLACLRGLIETDGSIHQDRGYVMVNFVTNSEILAKQVREMFGVLGFIARLSHLPPKEPRGPKFTVRLSRDVAAFIGLVRPMKE